MMGWRVWGRQERSRQGNLGDVVGLDYIGASTQNMADNRVEIIKGCNQRSSRNQNRPVGRKFSKYHEIRVVQPKLDRNANKTPSLTVVGISIDIAVAEALRILLRMGEPLSWRPTLIYFLARIVTLWPYPVYLFVLAIPISLLLGAMGH